MAFQRFCSSLRLCAEEPKQRSPTGDAEPKLVSGPEAQREKMFGVEGGGP